MHGVKLYCVLRYSIWKVTVKLHRTPQYGIWKVTMKRYCAPQYGTWQVTVQPLAGSLGELWNFYGGWRWEGNLFWVPEINFIS